MNYLAFHMNHDELAAYIHYEYGGIENRDRQIKLKSCYTKRRSLIKEIPDELLPREILEAAKVVDEAVKDNNWVWMCHKEVELDTLIRNSERMKRLHVDLCPNCPWNGHTIFTPEDDYV